MIADTGNQTSSHSGQRGKFRTIHGVRTSKRLTLPHDSENAPSSGVVSGAGRSNEAQLVQRARSGDRMAFEAIVQRYEQRIYTLTYRMMGNPDDAFDLTQECFIRAYTNLPRTSEDLNVSAWLHRIASNACLDILRRRKRVRWLPWDDTQHEQFLTNREPDDPERIAIARENTSDVERVLTKMSAHHRLALVLREYEGMSTSEIGDVMGLSRSAVKSTLFRARKEFRVIYRAEVGR